MLDLEDPEIPQFHPAFPDQRFDQGLERPLDQLPGAKLGKIDLFRDRPDDVFPGHGSGVSDRGPPASPRRREGGWREVLNEPEA